MALTDSDKRRIITSGIWIFVTALIVWFFSTYPHKKSVPETGQNNIKVGVDLLPHEFGIDSLGMMRGQQKQLMDLVLSDNDTIDWIPFNSRNDAIKALKNREIRIYATSLPYSVRQEYSEISPTEWLFRSKFSIIYHSTLGDWQKKFADSNKVVVTISKVDKMAKIMLDNLSELSYPAMEVEVRKESPLQLGMLLIKGEIEYLVCNSQLALSIAEMDPTLEVAENITIDTQQVWLVRQNDTLLLHQLNTKILELRESKEWQEIFRNN